MMRFRDRPHADSQTFRQFSELSPEAIDRLPAVLTEVASDPRAPAMRMRWPTDRRLGDLSAAEAAELAPRAIFRLEDGLDERSLIVAAIARPFVGLPLKVVISGGRVAFVCAHAAFDGSQFIELLAHVIARCAGLEHELDARRPDAHPILHALRSVPLRPAVREALRQRAARVAPPPTPRPSGADLRLETASVALLRLDAAELAAVRALPLDQDERRASLNVRICSLALTTLREVQRDRLDLPVDMPVNLRRYTAGRRVIGNFIGVVEIGGLRSADLRPARLAALTEQVLSSGAPLIGMLLGGLGPIRRRLRGALQRTSGGGGGELSITVTMHHRLEPFADAWAPASTHEIRVGTVGPWPSPTMVSFTPLGDGAQLSVWDEGGQFDLDAFTLAFRARLAHRPGTPTEETESA